MRLFFDLDGTIVDSKEGILNGLMIASEMMRIDIRDRNFFLSFIGPPVIESAKEKLNLNIIEARAFTKWFRDYYTRKGKYELKPYEKIEDVFKDSIKKGFKLSVVTSKPEYQARDIIKNLNFDKYFDKVFGSNDDRNLIFKKDIIKYAMKYLNTKDEEIYMIGDRYTDIEGAKIHNINSIAVLYGFGSFDELSTLCPDYMAKSTLDLKNIISKL